MLLVTLIRYQGITLRQCQAISCPKLETQTSFQQGTLWLIRNNSSSVQHSPNKRLIRNAHPTSPYLRLHQDLIPTWGQPQYNFLGRQNIHTTKGLGQWQRPSKGRSKHNLQEKLTFRTQQFGGTQQSRETARYDPQRLRTAYYPQQPNTRANPVQISHQTRPDRTRQTEVGAKLNIFLLRDQLHDSIPTTKVVRSSIRIELT